MSFVNFSNINIEMGSIRKPFNNSVFACLISFDHVSVLIFAFYNDKLYFAIDPVLTTFCYDTLTLKHSIRDLILSLTYHDTENKITGYSQMFLLF